MEKRYTRAQFIRTSGKLHIRPKIEFVGGLEVVEKKPSKHKRRRERVKQESEDEPESERV